MFLILAISNVLTEETEKKLRKTQNIIIRYVFTVSLSIHPKLLYYTTQN